jgi:hypothetical protein
VKEKRFSNLITAFLNVFYVDSPENGLLDEAFGNCCYPNKFAYNNIVAFDTFFGFYIKFQLRNTH